MLVPLRNTSGEVLREIEVSEELFGVPMNTAVVHQALVRQLANARQGTASTKTRAQVSGGGIKPHPQKHTGRARMGSIRSPLVRGGGIVFGPHPRSYRQRMPKKMRRLALKCVLSSKLAEGQLVVLNDFNLREPKSKDMAKILEALGVNSSALIVTKEPDGNVIKSTRNLERVRTLPASLLNVADLLKYDRLIMTEAAVRRAEELWAGNGSSKARAE